MGTNGVGRLKIVLLVFTVALAGGGQMTSSLAQTPPPTYEELVARVELLRSRLEVTTAVTVPVGGIIAWSGEISSIPVNFELCNGNEPTTPGAVYSGNKPNLIDRFVRGAGSSIGGTGGHDTIAQRSTGAHILSVTEMPRHRHGITDPGHEHGAADTGHIHPVTQLQHVPGAPELTGTGSWSYVHSTLTFNWDAPPFGFPRVSSDLGNANVVIDSATTGILTNLTGGAQAHDHTIPSHDNRPAYYELFYIIRVR